MTEAPTPASWTLFAALPGRAPAEALSEALEGMDPAPAGVGVFEMEDGSGLWEVSGHFEAAPDPAEVALLEIAFGAAMTVSEVPPTDWVAHVRRSLTPVEAGRFFVHGSHDDEAARAARAQGRETLLIEAAMAFGTGHHGTTLGCLAALDELLAAGGRPGSVLDLGCGTAVLAMAAARTLPGAEVLAGDIDPVAVEVAEANLAANDLADRVRVVEAAGTSHPRIAARRWDLIFANILKGPLVELAPDIAAVAAPDATAILSGLLHAQADAVSAAYLSAGFREDSRKQFGDWTVIVLRKG